MIDIFSISNENDFQKAVMDTFHYQSSECLTYAKYLSFIGVNSADVNSVDKIPFMPIELFKYHRIVSGSNPSQIFFTSSGTGSSGQSHHHVTDVTMYEKSFVEAFRQFIAPPENTNIFALLPGYMEREGSSLIYMVEYLAKMSPDSGFFLYNHEELRTRLQNRDKSRKTILFGVTFALLDMAEEEQMTLGDDVVVMETGGMKGRRREIPRDELHRILCKQFGVSRIYSEYGMCECLSQAYSHGEGIFVSPPWMRIITRDFHDPFRIMPHNIRGGINIIDLANRNSCAFLETQDLGYTIDSTTFKIEGRIDHSDTRGCSLLLNS